MARRARNKNLSKYYHLMIQGLNREFIFEKSVFKLKYLNYFKKSIEGKKIKLIAYCVMDNHIHMLISSDFIEELSQVMSSVNTKYAIYYNKMMNRCGYVFRDRYKSEIITDRKHLENCIKYIHNNPVKAKICESPSEYLYSSYNDFLNNKIESDILDLLYDGRTENAYALLENKDKYSFIDIENEDSYENPKEVIKEYNNYEYMNKEGIYNIIRDLKRRCKITNDEIACLLNIKRSSFYNILRKYKGNNR